MVEIVFPFCVLQEKARHSLLRSWGPYPVNRISPQDIFRSSTLSYIHVISNLKLPMPCTKIKILKKVEKAGPNCKFMTRANHWVSFVQFKLLLPHEPFKSFVPNILE
jgi:hypothetical protein